jgi:hypothetical protein
MQQVGWAQGWRSIYWFDLFVGALAWEGFVEVGVGGL